jgi:hypothetical protein
MADEQEPLVPDPVAERGNEPLPTQPPRPRPSAAALPQSHALVPTETPNVAPPLRGARGISLGVPKKSGLRHWMRTAGGRVLLGLSGFVGITGALVGERASFVQWLRDHNFNGAADLVGPWLLVIWVVLYIVNEVWLRAAGNAQRDAWVDAHQRIIGKMTGNTSEFTALLRNGNGRIPPTAAKQIVRSYLARAVEYAALLANDPSLEFRACCLVVTRAPVVGGRGERFLEAWVYDAPHKQAGTHGARKVEWGAMLAGRVASTGQVIVVDDCHDAHNRPIFGDPGYQTVIGFPLTVRTSDKGEVLGVVTVDASEKDVFKRDALDQRLEVAISPVLADIVLVLDRMKP